MTAGGSFLQGKSTEDLAKVSQQELIAMLLQGQQLLEQRDLKTAALAQENQDLKTRYDLLQEKFATVQGQYLLLKSKYFGRSSEKQNKGDVQKDTGNKKPRKPRDKPAKKLPSERYPNVPILETHIELAKKPTCNCCGSQMKDSGMTEDSEYLEVIPAEYYVMRLKRHKYRCGACHGDIQTSPSLPRIKAGSTYGDGLILDVALSKYCDLIPIERYSAIAGRQGLEDLPPQSLIETTHYLAQFVEGAYQLIKQEVLKAKVLLADETPHRMLEGDKKKNWRLWGFSDQRASYFEIRDTRSGDVASELLADSSCEYLGSDVYSGYAKAVRETNVIRAKRGLPLIRNFYCNAHSRRRFKEALAEPQDEIKAEEVPKDPDIEWFITQYKKIYKLNEDAENLASDGVQEVRDKMFPLFESMKRRAEQLQEAYSEKGKMGKALSYLLNNYVGLTLFLAHPQLLIDNNPMERRLRNPVIGRKTWYGTHSKAGAKTAAILFTLVESCKLIEVNPREYFKSLVDDLHQGMPPYTPSQYKQRRN